VSIDQWVASHMHPLVAEGVFLPDGTYVPLPKPAAEPFLRLFYLQGGVFGPEAFARASC
jgi:hypothetical protein